MTTTSREVHLVRRPDGAPAPEDFQLVEVELAEPGAGEVLVRNRLLSVDPYMRGRMNDAASYIPPFRLGEVMQGGAVGEVVASADPDLPVGATVVHMAGWREHAVVPGRRLKVVDPDAAPLSAYLGVLGMPGLTAYVGLLDIAAMQPGDAVFVSAAAGAVGSLAGQLARLKGASRVVGSAGSAAKVRFLVDELGFDAAFDYHDGPVLEQLREHAPEGIDVYYDNVGGDHLEAALDVLRPFGRVAMCGAISQYNATAPTPAPRNLGLVVGKRLTLRGFIASDHGARQADLVREVGGWLRDGQIVARETAVEGIENAVEGFLGLLRGDNTGKMVVRVGG